MYCCITYDKYCTSAAEVKFVQSCNAAAVKAVVYPKQYIVI